VAPPGSGDHRAGDEKMLREMRAERERERKAREKELINGCFVDITNILDLLKLDLDDFEGREYIC
jgi:hypothetical protein